MLIYDGSDFRPIVDIYSAIASGLGAVIYKATEGISITHRTYSQAKELCIKNGVLFGAYHFARTGISPVAQADYFLRQAQPDDKMLVALDWENEAGTLPMTVAEAEQYVTRINQVLFRYPVIYSRKNFLEPLDIHPDSPLLKCPLWVASYQNSPNWPKQWYTYCLHQYSNGTDGPLPHGIAGIRPDIDMNKFNPRFGDIADWWGTDIVEPTVSPKIADKFQAPFYQGMQDNGLWLRQRTTKELLWYDANPFLNPYTLGNTTSLHTGADLNQYNDGDKYQVIRAVANGVILFADRITIPGYTTWGNLIIQESHLPDGSKVWFRYAHSDNLQVKAGDLVEIGDHLSDVSNAFGQVPYHLHFDVSLSGVLAQGLDGAIDWPGMRHAYLLENYTDPYNWLLAHMNTGGISVPNIVTATVVAPTRVDITQAADHTSEVIDVLKVGDHLQLDLEKKVTNSDNQDFYLISDPDGNTGYISADTVAFAQINQPVIKYVNTPDRNLVVRSTGANFGATNQVKPNIPHATKITALYPPNSAGYVQVVTVNGIARSGYVSSQFLIDNLPK